MYNAKGELVWHGTLDIYGRITVKKGDKYDCPFRYQGQYYDKETQLAYNRFRYYDPKMGMYISQDPIGFVSGELNLYSYTVDSNRELDIYGLYTYNTMGRIKPLSDGTEVAKHHIIPKSLGGAGKKKYTHPAIAKAGINIHGSKNIMLLPKKETKLTKRSIHPGNTKNHLAYNERIKGKLDQIDRIGVAKGRGQADCEKAVNKLIARERKNLRTGKTHLH